MTAPLEPPNMIRSERPTTSSRKPGADGRVNIRGVGLVACGDCGGLWIGLGVPGEHGARVARGRCGHLIKVNCKGNRIGDCLACIRTQDAGRKAP